MMRADRTPLRDLSTPDLTLRIRWTRARNEACAPDSTAWLLLEAQETELLATLRDRFGGEILTPPALEWLSGGRQSARRPANSTAG